MFDELNRGWHSETMHVTYVPLPTFIDRDGSMLVLTTKVRATTLLKLTAIRYHEDPGHSAQQKLPLLRFKQLVAARGYEALWEVMRRGSSKHWFQLQKLNHFINNLDAATALVSELHATFIGFSSMRDNLPARFWPKVKELEDESVAYLADKFGMDNKKQKQIFQQYRDLAKNFSHNDMSRMINEQMIVMKELVATSLFDSIGLNQFVQCGDANALVQDELGRSKKCLSQRGLARFNPISGREIAEQSQFFTSTEIENAWIEIPLSYEDWFKLQSGESDYPRYFEIDDGPALGSKKKAYAYIEDLLLTFGRDFPVEVELGIDPGKVGFCFIRLQRNGSTQPWLVPYLSGFQKNYDFPSRAGLIWEAVTRADIAALIFFETLRVMVANKYLLGCPMRFIPWAVRTGYTLFTSTISGRPLIDGGFGYRFLANTECCGRVDLLMRLYEAGKKAGFPEQTWRKPTKCLSCCPPSHGEDVSRPVNISPWLSTLEDYATKKYPSPSMETE
jgi:hypothetical protein